MSYCYIQVCGIESAVARSPDDYEALLLGHCRLLSDGYPRAALVFCVESNLGFESSHISRMVQDVRSVIIMYEAKSGVPGMQTTHQSKEVMHSLLSDKLRENAVAFVDPLLTCGTTPPEKLRAEMLTQLSNYAIVVDRPDKMSQPFKFARKTYTGKHWGNDDLCVMLQFNLLAHKRFFANARYRRYW